MRRDGLYTPAGAGRFGSIIVAGCALFGLSACAVMSDSEVPIGYGPFPQDYRNVIERHLASRFPQRDYQAMVWTEPKAHYDRIEGNWLYGWRICVGLQAGGNRTEQTAPLGYYLINNGRVIHFAVGRPVPGDLDGLAAADRCPSPLGDGAGQRF